MPAGVGWPSKIFPPQPPSLLSPTGGHVLRAPTLIQHPPVGQEQVAAGATTEHRDQPIALVVVRIIVSIPREVTGYLEIDGIRIINSRDREGLVGQLELGDMAAGVGLPITRIGGQFTNNAVSGRDARFWIVGAPA